MCVYIQKMEQGFRWEFVTRKTRINKLNEKRSLITWGLRGPIWKINFCSRLGFCGIQKIIFYA